LSKRREVKGRPLPPRPNEKVRKIIGRGGRNECVVHTTKRQKSRAASGVIVVSLHNRFFI